MRTTVDIADDLLIMAKKRAVEMHKPLRSLIEEGLRTLLEANSKHVSSSEKIVWITASGGVPKGLDLSDRAAMYEWMDSDQK